jgi:hypothetical protein
MKLTSKLILFAVMAASLISCEEISIENIHIGEDSIQLTDSSELSVNSDALKANLEAIDTLLNEMDSSIIREIEAVREEEEGWAKYTGEHALTLQWIGFDNPGTCNFELEAEGVFYVVGSQKNETGDELSIDGTLTMQGNAHLLFNGVIKSKIDHLNNGEVCIREGEYNFKATGTRKYWRLQEMDNCEEGNVVDYIDIYFKQ